MVPFIKILDMCSMQASLKPHKHLRLILAFTLYITHALTLSHLLDTLGITMYLINLYYLSRYPHKCLIWFPLTFFTFSL